MTITLVEYAPTKTDILRATFIGAAMKTVRDLESFTIPIDQTKTICMRVTHVKINRRREGAVTDIQEALEWADWITYGKKLSSKMVKRFETDEHGALLYPGILAREYRKLRDAGKHYEKWLDKEWPPINSSLDEAINSGDGTYKP